jgi:hypothetical protein
MDWMWAFLKATLMPVLIVGTGARFLYQTLFPTLLPIRVRRTRCYHTRRRMDRRRQDLFCVLTERLHKAMARSRKSDSPQNTGSMKPMDR